MFGLTDMQGVKGNLSEINTMPFAAPPLAPAPPGYNAKTQAIGVGYTPEGLASRTQIDLHHAPYVLYGVKYIGLVSLAPFFTLRWPVEHNSHKIKMARNLDALRPRL